MKFYSAPVEEHQDVPLADDGQWEQLVAHWKKRESGPKVRDAEGNRCYVVSVSLPGEAHAEGKRNEIVGLVHALEDQVVGSAIQPLRKPDPKTYLGKGMSRDIAQMARSLDADMLVLDVELTPSQMRNLEDVTGLPVCDREAVILNVFFKHARTKAARIQVEIAHLEYLRPRIRGLGLNMDQQAGGIMRARGPGETASELMARKLDGRLAVLRKGLARLERQGSNQRKHRDACRRVALVGYTNAGKTSLMNALTAAEGSARDMPFETLDTTTRSLTRYGGDVLLSDTVGFIRNLPKRLFASFASTLAEIVEASLVAIVIDVSDPDWELHLKTTEDMLNKLEASDLPRCYVFNKLDLLEEEPSPTFFEKRAGGHPHFALSAHHPEEVQVLKDHLIRLARGSDVLELFVPYEQGEVMNKVYASCQILESTPEDTGIHFRVEGDAKILAQLQHVTQGGER